MSSLRALMCLGGLAAMGGLLAAACGSDADSADPNGSGTPDGGAPTDEGGSADAKADGPSVNGPFTFRDRLAGWSGGYTGGFYRAHGYPISGKRLFSVPDALTTSLGAVTLVDISTAKPRVFTLPVVGKVPAGTVESFVYEPAIDRMILVVRSPQATKVEIVTIALSDKEATFATLTQAGPPITSKSLIGPLYATGGAGVIVAGLGNTVASVTIAGSTATWSAESAGSLYPGNSSPAMEDPAHGRVLGFGKMVYDPATMKGHTEPNVTQLSLAPPYTWTEKPFGGDAPPNTDGIGYSFTVYDEKGNRVLASSLHDSTCGAMACKINGLWSFDLGTNQWTKLQDFWSSPHAYGGTPPFIVQQDARRVLEPSDGVLLATSLDTAANPTLAGVLLAQDGDLGPVSPLGTTVLADQRIVSTDGQAFRVLDPTQATPRWERFGTATMPSGFDRGASISADPKTGEILVFGTPRLGGTPTGTEVHVLSADGKKLTKVTTASSPPPRSYHGALVADGTLYVAAGTTGEFGTPILDDVWSFDRASSTWTKIAKLPTALSFVSLSLGANNEILVLGRVASGSNDSKSSQVFAVDRTTHKVRTMDAVPAKFSLWSIAAYRGCFIGYESGDTVDGSKPNVWRCSIENGATKWTSTVLDEHDFALHELRGATAPDGLRAYFIGRHLWEAIGK
jgi:Kelch motif